MKTRTLAVMIVLGFSMLGVAPSTKVPPSIVMIDTGTESAFEGTLNLEKNCDHCWNIHGTQMSEALEDQLVELKSKPVQAKQLVWSTGPDIPLRVLQATRMKPRVISMSLSGGLPVKAERLAIQYASDSDVLVLAASGNDGQAKANFPARYKIPCLVAVSTKRGGKIAQWNQTANPGEIYIEQARGEQGTSFSTQRAAAYALVFFQKNPKATCKDAKAYLVREFGSVQPDVKLGNGRHQQWERPDRFSSRN